MLDYKGYRVKIIIIALVLTISLLAGGTLLFDMMMVQRPLTDVLDGSDQIREHDTFTRNGVTVVTVSMGQVQDWSSFYRSLTEDVEEVLGDRPFQLQIEDSRDLILAEAYQRMHYALQEAAVKGNFVMMAKTVDALALQMELDSHHLHVDERHIFLELRHEDYRLYEVVERLSEGSDS